MLYFLIFISAIFVNNIVLSQFLGICPFLGVSKKIDTALGMGAAVTFVLVLATIVTYLLQMLLDAFGLGFLQTILFILVIATLVQMIEIILKKISPSLYQALGVFLPLITTNCCILGVAILVANGTNKLPQGLDHNLLTGTLFALATALGFAIALVLFAGLREQLRRNDVPKAMEGTPIALITAGILAMAFMGFSGVI
ncbi:MAG: RnfABCDGE type electron transport complex subunit A [Paludibacteraceae bacterium]|nr:RnfABCDGE type electron transport complex subunit A [Paludibacteraceae bacterium]